MTALQNRWAELRAALPAKVEQREVKVPEGIPGHDDWIRFGRDTWRQLSRAIYTDGTHVLVWRPTDPDPDLAILITGDRAQAAIARFAVREGAGA